MLASVAHRVRARCWGGVLLLPALLALAVAADTGSRGLALEGLVSGDTAADAAAGFAVADAPRAFEFPADHGPHPDYRSEWWYLVAHLRDQDGRRFGAQFTLFRQALAPPETPLVGASRWRSRQVWMAHVALTSPSGHQASERFARGALGLAGVQAQPFRAWIEDWQLRADDDADWLPMTLTARVDDSAEPFALHLQLSRGRGPLLQGDDGLSRKGEQATNASYYYSQTRLPVAGEIELAGRRYQVEGLGWIDREWSTSVLEPGQVGWDWFALHLDDGRDLMLFQVRDASGRASTRGGMLATGDNKAPQPLEPGADALQPLAYWNDERGNAWPVRWQLSLPELGVEGRIAAWHEDQLNRLAVRYWEGPVCLQGTVNGCGFMELTGYNN